LSQIVIDDPHGFETRFSILPESPAAPYVRRFLPQTLEDLYEIGIIPKHIALRDLKEARDVGLKAGLASITVTNRSLGTLPLAERRRYVEASSEARTRETSVRATAHVLVSRQGHSIEHADLLARKIHSLDHLDVNAPIPFYSVSLADDLVVRTPLVIDPSIDGLTAKAVVIHQSGEIRAQGRYFLLRCESIQGEGYWFRSSAFFDPNKQSMHLN
jgi:hypothetical protein